MSCATTEKTETCISLSVRVPRDTDASLATAIERRLEGVNAIGTVTIDELHGLKPGLSATVADVTVTLSTGKRNGALQSSLSECVFIKHVEKGN
jgi:hypothetical protein